MPPSSKPCPIPRSVSGSPISGWRFPTRAADAGGARRIPEGRDREMVADHQGGWHQNGVRLVVTAPICRISRFAKMKEGPVSISVRRRSRIETPLIVSKTQRTQRRPVEAAMLHVHPFRVNATNVPRRRFLHLAASAATLPAISRGATAQTYPSRPITMIVPFAAGGLTDVVGRVVAERMVKSLGQPIIIENVTGADGSIGVRHPDRWRVGTAGAFLPQLVRAFRAQRHAKGHDRQAQSCDGGGIGR